MLNAVDGGSREEDSVRPAKSTLDLGLPKLPDIVAFDSDRNRTSPLAFTGNKFEFRAPGSSQAMAIPVMSLLSVWAAGLEEFLGMFEERINNGEEPVDAAINTIREANEISRNIRFEGDAYTEGWHAEAERRGLVKARTIPEGIDLFVEPSTLKMLSDLGLFSEKEMEAFHTIKLENFVKNIEIEMAVTRDMVWEGILPAISKQLLLEKDSFSIADSLGIPGSDDWKSLIAKLASATITLIQKTKELSELREKMAKMPLRDHAEEIVNSAVPLMQEIRNTADSIEIFLSKENMHYPKYRDLLSLSA